MKMVNGLVADIHEANLDYLISARMFLAEDKTEAIKRLGITAETAEILECLSLLQVVQLAENNSPISELAFDDHLIGQVLAGKKFCHAVLRSIEHQLPNNAA